MDIPDLIPTETREELIRLERLTLLPDLQLRCCVPELHRLQVHDKTVEDYRELLAEGTDLGPLEVIEEVDDSGARTGRLLLADGFHRWEAHRQLHHETVLCRIRKGTFLTGVLLAAKLNGGRGLQFTRADRIRVAEKLLKGLAAQGITWSDVEIARWAGIHRRTVAHVRYALKTFPHLPTARQVMRNGQLYTMQLPMRPAAGNNDDELDGPDAYETVERPAPSRRSPPSSSAHRGKQHTSAPPQSPTSYSGVPSVPGKGETQQMIQPVPENSMAGYPPIIPGDTVGYRVVWARRGPFGVVDHGVIDYSNIEELPEDVWQLMKRNQERAS